MADIWDRVDEAIDRDPLLLRGIVAEVLAEREHALAELSSLRDHRARWQTEHERAEQLAAEMAVARQTIQAIRDHHHPEAPPGGHQWVSGGRAPHCAGYTTGDPYLDTEWPCDTIRLLDLDRPDERDNKDDR